jgi:multidrug resistance efflux pump
MYSLAGEMKLIERELTAAKAECDRLRFLAGPSAMSDDSIVSAYAELTRLRAEVERLKGALALGQQNCDDAYDDLREERDEAIARAEKAEAALAAMKGTP